MPASPEISTIWPWPVPGAALARDAIGALGLASDEAGEPRGMRRLEAALARRHAERRKSLDRLGEALDRMPAQLLQPEPVADQPPRRRRDNDAVRFGKPLQPRGEIGRVADDRLLLRRPLPYHVADDDEAGRDPDAHGEFLARACLQARHDRQVYKQRRSAALAEWSVLAA